MVVAVALVLCDSTKSNAENHAVVAARRAVAVAPEVAAAVGAVARVAVLPEVAHRPVVHHIERAMCPSWRIAGPWPSA